MKDVKLLIARLEAIKIVSRLSGVAVVRDFIERRIQPIKERHHPAFEDSGREDPTRESSRLWVPRALEARTTSLFQTDVSLKDIPMAKGYTLECPPNRVSTLAWIPLFVFFSIRSIMAVCFVQERCPVFVSHPPLPGEAPQVEVAGAEEAAEDPTIPPLTRKRKGKEVADPVVKKAKVSTPLLTGGALRIGGGGGSPPPMIGGVGGARPTAPALRPAAEAGEAPPASPLLVPIERSTQRAT